MQLEHETSRPPRDLALERRLAITLVILALIAAALVAGIPVSLQP